MPCPGDGPHRPAVLQVLRDERLRRVHDGELALQDAREVTLFQDELRLEEMEQGEDDAGG